ncbi:MAG: tripartite tricarboxylate transporter permease [Sphaerochaeta sp.]|nr:tripartite tricarboxylate transporter permease [Sphaerochaeta sp.]
MDFSTLLNGFLQVFHLDNFIFIFLGVFIGIVFGAIPGLSGALAMVIFLPFSFSLSPVVGISMLMAIYCGGCYGGSVSAILLGTPGSNEAAATVLDGYPLAKRGYARKALEVALLASTIGGLLSSVALLFFAPAISTLTLRFSSPEYFMLAIFGLSIISGVSGESLLKGLLAGCIGIMISMIGMDDLSGLSRFTFNNVNLLSGVNLIAMMLGLFAIPVLVEKMENKEYELKLTEIVSMTNKEGVTKKEFKKIFPSIVKSSLIGIGIGALPGTGAAIASFISYNEAKRSSKHPEEFGHGALEGIAAPEAGNNGVTAAALIPLLTLAIPGSAAVATLIGALMMHGLVPGPQLFQTQGATVYAIMFSIVIANIAMFAEGKVLARFFAKVIQVPQVILMPMLTIFCFAGAYAAKGTAFNILVLVIAGIASFALAKLGIPHVPLLLGVILGPIAETNLRNSLTLSNGSWLIFLTRPISLAILALTIFLVILVKWQDQKLRRKTGNASDNSTGTYDEEA